MHQQTNGNGSSRDELIETIRRRYAEGATLKDLAAELDRNSEWIRRAMQAAGISRRRQGPVRGKYLRSGGIITDRGGYRLVRAMDHPHSNFSGYVRMHRLVVEASLGRYLETNERVRHRDGDPANNDLSNLELFDTDSREKSASLKGNTHAAGDTNNPKRRGRKVRRSPDELLDCLRQLAASLNRPVQRSDLQPPMPSYKSISRVFGSWQTALALALDDKLLTGWRAAQAAQRAQK